MLSSLLLYLITYFLVQYLYEYLSLDTSVCMYQIAVDPRDPKSVRGLSEEEVSQRVALQRAKQSVLERNSNLHVVRTRICLRNLPRALSDRELRSILARAAGCSPLDITEV